MPINSILSTPAEELIPDVPTKYVDVHGLFRGCLDQIKPHSDAAPTNLLFNSDHGLGKTLLAADLTQSLGSEIGIKIPLIVFDCSEDTREYDLMGLPTPIGGGDFAFQLGPFPLAIKLANEVGAAVLLAEEISALPPGAQKAFNRMTDWRRGLYVPQIGQMFKLAPDAHLVIMGTMNPSAYGGVYTLNADLRSRFGEIRLPAPSTKELSKILKSVCPWAPKSLIDSAAKIAAESRSKATEYSLSTRDLVNLLTAIHRSGDREFALQMMLNKFEGTETNLMADRINAVFGSSLKGKGAAAHV